MWKECLRSVCSSCSCWDPPPDPTACTAKRSISKCVKIRGRKIFIYTPCVGAFWLSLKTPCLPPILFFLSCLTCSPLLPLAPPSAPLPLMNSSCSQESGLAGSSVAAGIGLGSCTRARLVQLGCPPDPWLTAGGQPHPSWGAELIQFELQASLHLFPIHLWVLGFIEEEGLSERD